MRKPLATTNRIIVDPVKPGEKETESGLILPDSAVQTEHNGIIVSVGSEVTDPLIKEGAEIVYNHRSGAEIIVGKKTYLAMRDVDVLSVISEEKLDLVK